MAASQITSQETHLCLFTWVKRFSDSLCATIRAEHDMWRVHTDAHSRDVKKTVFKRLISCTRSAPPGVHQKNKYNCLYFHKLKARELLFFFNLSIFSRPTIKKKSNFLAFLVLEIWVAE